MGRLEKRRNVLLGLLVLLGVFVRAREIDQPIVTFHPTRHYRSAMLARACYYDLARHVPEEARAVANANRQMQQAGELPVMEWLACGAYLGIGHEVITIPRVLAALIWVSGVIPLWLLGRRLASSAAAFVAASLFLFLPYGIVASRNFQPDPLMTVASLWAIVALLGHHDSPTRSRCIAAAALVGVAALVKPMSVFVTVPVALVLARGVTIAAAGMIAPTIYYGYSAVAGTLVQDQMRMRFEPHLVATGFFWTGLARMVARVHTVPIFLVALAAVVFAGDRLARRILMALFAGYLAFALVFTYHVPTHDYYHLPYIAAVSLGAAAMLARINPPAIAVYGLCSAVAIAGSVYAWPRLHLDAAPMLSSMYQEIGEVAAHDTKALFLDANYGFALMYHAGISGDSWPNRDDLAAEAIDGRAPIEAEARFERDYEDWGPRYFILTDLASLSDSPGLQALLDRRTVPVRITDRYRVYRFTR